MFGDLSPTISTLKTLVDHGKLHTWSISIPATMDKPYEAPKGSLLPTFVVFLFVLVLLYGLFLFTQQLILKREINRAEADVTSIEEQLEVYEKDRVQEISNARDISERVKASRILWSGVVKRIQALTPSSIFYSSYTASEEGEIQLAGYGSTYESVAGAISQMYLSSDFDGTFVPSISQGNAGDGQSVASFSISFDYLP